MTGLAASYTWSYEDLTSRVDPADTLVAEFKRLLAAVEDGAEPGESIHITLRVMAV